MDNIHKLWSLLFAFVNIYFSHNVNATCSYPDFTSKHYGLTQNRTSYAIGDKFDVYCKPQYAQSGNASVFCQSTGLWKPSFPSCNDVGSAPWWALLIGVMGAIILIPCILPRIFFCMCGEEKKHEKQQEEVAERAREEFQRYDYDDDLRQRQDVAHWGASDQEKKQAMKAEVNMDF